MLDNISIINVGYICRQKIQREKGSTVRNNTIQVHCGLVCTMVFWSYIWNGSRGNQKRGFVSLAVVIFFMMGRLWLGSASECEILYETDSVARRF